jgi:hypothetical protein
MPGPGRYWLEEWTAQATSAARRKNEPSDGDDPLEQRLELRVLLGEVRQAGP